MLVELAFSSKKIGYNDNRHYICGNKYVFITIYLLLKPVFMKKFLFLMLSVAVAVSASAGVNLKEGKKGMMGKTPVTLKMDKKEKMTKTPFKTLDFKVSDYHVDLKERFRGASDVMYDQPAGELKTFIRSGWATYLYKDSNNQTQLGIDEQEGDVNIVYD